MPPPRADLERLLEGACTAFCHCAAHRRAHDTRFWRQRELDALEHLERVLADLRPQLAAPTETDLTWPPEVFT